jgi:3-methyladenine DNA glycosylase Tag
MAVKVITKPVETKAAPDATAGALALGVVTEQAYEAVKDAVRDALKAAAEVKKLEADPAVVKYGKAVKAASDAAAVAVAVATEYGKADEEFNVSVLGRTVRFGQRALVRSIRDLEAVRKRLTHKVFMEVAKVSIGDLEKYMTGIEVEEVLDSGRTGRRKMTVVEDVRAAK